MTSTLWLYIGGVVLAIILLVAFWRKIVRALLLLAVLGLGGMIAWAFAQQATATRQVATTAHTLARSNVAGNVIVLLLLGLLVAGAGVVGYIYLRWRLAHNDRQDAWTDTPYAPYPLEQRHDTTQQVNMLVQLEVLRALRALRELRAPGTTALVPVDDNADDDGGDVYGAWWGNA